jgi:phenylacetate-CoA ligase
MVPIGMYATLYSWKYLKSALDVWRSSRAALSIVEARQKARLKEMLNFVRGRSSFYRKLYKHLSLDPIHLKMLPPVTKPELMDNFDEWVTDAAVTKAGIEAFVARKELVGRSYLGRYAVWTTSGVTGKPGIFVHDRNALAVYFALLTIRIYLTWMTPRHLFSILRRGASVEGVFVTGGHFASGVVRGLSRRLFPWAAGGGTPLSALAPLPELVRALDEVQPAVLLSYPSVMSVLAQERLAGRLRISPVLIGTVSEMLTHGARNEISAAFGCPVRDVYAASEFPGIAFECCNGSLHVNSDWVILEPVDDAYQPAPPGDLSSTVLLTNLANRIQPLIRYDLGDRVRVCPEPCPCGNPLPSIRVEGRHDEILSLLTQDGKCVQVVPMAIATVIEETPGVRRFQVIQQAPVALKIRLEVAPEADSHLIWGEVFARLRDYLSVQGLPSIKIEKATEPPQREVESGKFRQVQTSLEGGDRKKV